MYFPEMNDGFGDTGSHIATYKTRWFNDKIEYEKLRSISCSFLAMLDHPFQDMAAVFLPSEENS